MTRLSPFVEIKRWHAFLIIWFAVFLTGLDLTPETNLLIMLPLSLAYGVAVFLPAYTTLWLLRRGVEGVLLGTALVLVILVLSVAVGSYTYHFRDTRDLPRDLFVSGAAFLTGFVWRGAIPPPQVARNNTTYGVDALWVQQFLLSTNLMRSGMGLPSLTENTTLDGFAGLRAHTAMSHYGITHYGRDRDFSCFYLNCVPSSELNLGYYVYDQRALSSLLGAGASYLQPTGGDYWQLSLSCGNCAVRTVYFTSQQAVTMYISLVYGNHTHLAFLSGNALTLLFPSEPTEEILYPRGSPSSYVTFLQQNATAHWNGFLNRATRSYGFDLELGVALVPSATCPVTEIPGPNIDIAQFYTQNGCTFYYGLTEWLVIELGT